MSSSETEVSPTVIAAPGTLDPYQLASGIIKNDFIIVILATVLCCSASFGISMVLPSNELSLWLGIVTERAIHLFIVSFIVWRWRRKLEVKSGNSFGTILLRTWVAGFVVWSITLFPFLLLSLSNSETLVLTSAAVLTFSAIFALQYFFYFATIGIVGGPLRRLITSTRLITQVSPVSPLKAIAFPIALTALVMALALAPFPDGRSIVFNSLAGSAEGIFTILSTYTGIAFALFYLDDATWKAAGLDPFREDRLKTLAVRSTRSSLTLFSNRNALKLLVVALIVFAFNLSRQSSMLPAAKITIAKVSVGDRRIRVEIDVSDPEYQLVGFRPLAFSLAGEGGTPISSGIVVATTSATNSEILPALSPSTTTVRLFVEFEANRLGADLRSLEDLWLWYYGNKIAPIKPEMMGTLPADIPSDSSESPLMHPGPSMNPVVGASTTEA